MPIPPREPEPFEVYWMEKRKGKKGIYHDTAIGIQGNQVLFADSGWNPIESCFFTEAQCRTFHDMPQKDHEDWKAKLIGELDALITEWRGY